MCVREEGVKVVWGRGGVLFRGGRLCWYTRTCHGDGALCGQQAFLPVFFFLLRFFSGRGQQFSFEASVSTEAEAEAETEAEAKFSRSPGNDSYCHLPFQFLAHRVCAELVFTPQLRAMNENAMGKCFLKWIPLTTHTQEPQRACCALKSRLHFVYFWPCQSRVDAVSFSPTFFFCFSYNCTLVPFPVHFQLATLRFVPQNWVMPHNKFRDSGFGMGDSWFWICGYNRIQELQSAGRQQSRVPNKTENLIGHIDCEGKRKPNSCLKKNTTAANKGKGKKRKGLKQQARTVAEKEFRVYLEWFQVVKN